MADPRGPFRPDARLDRSQVTDRRSASTMRIGGRSLRKRGTRIGGTVFAVPHPVSVKPSRIGNPVRRGIRNDHTPAGKLSIRKVKGVRLREGLADRTGAGRSRGGSFGLLSGIDSSKFNARGQAILAEMRSSGTTITPMAVPRLSDIGRLLTGGRKGVPAHVSPVKPPALTSLIPNLFNQSQVGHTLRGALRRRMGTSRTMRPIAKPGSRRGGSARTM